MRRLLRLGLPAAGQVTLEVGVFAAATALAGRLAPASLAAHQIAVNLAAFTFMVPLGVASAGAVRVGQAVGPARSGGAARSGWTALLFGACSWRVRRLRSCSFRGASSAPSRPDPAVVDDRRVAPVRRRSLSVVRRCAGRRDRRRSAASAIPARPCCGTSRPLVHRPAARIRAVFQRGAMASSGSGGDCPPA